MSDVKLPEPWLRGSLKEVPAVPRAVLHALQLAQEDLRKWCGGLSDEEMQAQPHGLASVAFHLRHIPASMDRLLTYAEGRALTEEQLAVMKRELADRTTKDELFAALSAACQTNAQRIQALGTSNFDEPRFVGGKRLPTTLGGLLVHVADHTQRHVGQAIVTAKLVMSQRAQAENR